MKSAMKIRPSLKLYFFITMILLGSIMTIGLSMLTVNYFIDGLDRGLNGVMRELVRTSDVHDGQPVKFAGFQIASRWEDTPDIIQKRFESPPAVENELLKSKDQNSFFSLPTNLYFIAMIRNQEGELRYISKVMLDKFNPQRHHTPHISRFLWIIITGVLVIAMFTCFLIVLMRKVAKPIESLRDWAKALNHENVQHPPPDFTYNELNTLATIVQSSLHSVHQSLAREKTFLSYASHELRTPISVIRSNVDLLKRLCEQATLNEKQQLTLARIERAGLTMSDLTETLLWLSHDEAQSVELKRIQLDEKIHQLSSELRYLLNSKAVEVTIDCKPFSLDTDGTACHIVLSNLIRNAYQHTQRGHVHITQQDSVVTIINEEHRDSGSHSNNKIKTTQQPVLGYGLGLQLSERIVQRHKWQYQIIDEPCRYLVKVDFKVEIS
ncbi:HAMP domain-containing histidine kinase [Paraglaciecola agarilytica]|uniref:sensor histidine kinase n=1 Tax=Paraglaciecola chathamensis TaxID=368405 RepID=UPI001C0A4106|nr:HAMP domain-containing sensor histidine kinase [Paraglaciecola agarilytica]MBU3019512.1 HAMP domain-containing histidine kinase [Paraglaciecola agarilytica]